MRVLDLFCGAGGAGKGYSNAGFEVVGIDIEPQPRYPFEFHQLDAIAFLKWYVGLPESERRHFDLIHASPPCQAWSDLQRRTGLQYPELIEPIRELLQQIDIPYIIENVEGAPLIDPIKLCGTAFPGLRVIRHRLFESNLPLVGTTCPKKHQLVFTHDKRKSHYGKLNQDEAFVQVTGGGNSTLANARDAMGIDWMTKAELNEAIPPAYTEFLGKQAKSLILVNPPAV